MTSKAFRAIMAESARDLDDVKGMILGAAELHDETILRDTVQIRDKIVEYQGRIIMEYLGYDPHGEALGDSKQRKQKIQPFPRPGQSPASIRADMVFIIQHYWDLVEQHEEMDPAFSSEVLTSDIKLKVSRFSQKLKIAKMFIQQQDPSFWTDANEQELVKVLDHAAQVLSR